MLTSRIGELGSTISETERFRWAFECWLRPGRNWWESLDGCEDVNRYERRGESLLKLKWTEISSATTYIWNCSEEERFEEAKVWRILNVVALASPHFAYSSVKPKANPSSVETYHALAYEDYIPKNDVPGILQQILRILQHEIVARFITHTFQLWLTCPSKVFKIMQRSICHANRLLGTVREKADFTTTSYI